MLNLEEANQRKEDDVTSRYLTMANIIVRNWFLSSLEGGPPSREESLKKHSTSTTPHRLLGYYYDVVHFPLPYMLPLPYPRKRAGLYVSGVD